MYWDNNRIFDYYESQRRSVPADDRDTYFVKIYIISIVTVDDDGKVNNITADSESALAEFEDLAVNINYAVDDFDNPLPPNCYGYVKELKHVQTTSTCYLPLVTEFVGVVTEEYLDIIDNIMTKYRADVRYHVRNF